MELAKIILLLGILLNIVGFIILFRYVSEPLPPTDYSTYIYSEAELKIKNQQLAQKRAVFRKWSRLGFGINIVGFALQISCIFL